MADFDQFQEYMNDGTNFSWSRDWKSAIESFSNAVQLMPDDPDAHINLGLALLNDGQLEQALRIYKRAHRLSPDDSLPLERCGDILERLNQDDEAAQQYVKVAEVYLAQRDIRKSIEAWSRATALSEGLISIHARLAQAYEKIGNKSQAIREYLTLAHNFNRAGDSNKATRAVERSLRLDSKNSAALNALRALRSGGNLYLPDSIIKRPRPELKEIPKGPIGFDLDGDLEVDAEANPLGPIGEAMDSAMEMLAEFVVESGQLNTEVMYAMQGMESQRQEEYETAIGAYKQAISGLNHVSVKMNLGGLMVLSEEPKVSIQYLEAAAQDTRLAPGALHGLGLAYYQMDDHTNAARCLIQSLQYVDMANTTNEIELRELSTVYETLLQSLSGRNAEALKAINSRFISLLSGKDWVVRIPETRRHLDETLRDEGGQGLVDFLVAKGSDELTDIVSGIDRYIRQGLYTLAMDEAHRAVEKSPFYLPVHVRMAEVMMKEGRIRQAINKYNTVARAYLVREENDRAASILEEVLEMAPLDVDVRVNLIELLEAEDRWSEALDQYVDLAETFQQLGDFEQANSTFAVSEQLAIRIDAPMQKRAIIKHHLADIAQMRLDTRTAQKTYEDILEITPDDERALRALIEIYYTQGNQVEAVKRLDALLGLYAKGGRIQDIIRLLEQLVATNPNDPALRKRLSSIYNRRGMKREAIEQLDALGELQLDAGLTREAAQTIKQIIGLKPDRIEDYERLLSQLGG